uniref:Uncharacterized protein n=1 Tax=Electrophorus electricus TaxID=8005 RepID=A0AAY5EV61_ELEEL
EHLCPYLTSCLLALDGVRSGRSGTGQHVVRALDGVRSGRSGTGQHVVRALDGVRSGRSGTGQHVVRALNGVRSGRSGTGQHVVRALDGVRSGQTASGSAFKEGGGQRHVIDIIGPGNMGKKVTACVCMFTDGNKTDMTTTASLRYRARVTVQDSV